jgi:hypothetical protein
MKIIAGLVLERTLAQQAIRAGQASGQLGIDRGALDVFVSEPIFDTSQVGSPVA